MAGSVYHKLSLSGNEIDERLSKIPQAVSDAQMAVGIAQNLQREAESGKFATIPSDWNQTNENEPDYIKNKPEILQSDWQQTDDSQTDYIKNKPEILQSDWQQPDDSQTDYIKNKPDCVEFQHFNISGGQGVSKGGSNLFGGVLSFHSLEDLQAAQDDLARCVGDNYTGDYRTNIICCLNGVPHGVWDGVNCEYFEFPTPIYDTSEVMNEVKTYIDEAKDSIKLKDQATGVVYELCVVNGKLTLKGGDE